MDNFYTIPLIVKIFGNQTTVAPCGLVLAAQQARFMKEFRADGFFNLSLGKQSQKVFFVSLPVSFILFEIVKDLLCGRQHGLVDVIYLADRSEKITKVIALGKTRQLGNIVKPYVDDALDPCPHQARKKLLSRLLRETNGKYLYFVHDIPCPSSNV